MIFRGAAGRVAGGLVASPCSTVELDPSVTAAFAWTLPPGPKRPGGRPTAPAVGAAVLASGTPGSAPQPLTVSIDSTARPGTKVRANRVAGPRERGEMIGNMR